MCTPPPCIHVDNQEVTPVTRCGTGPHAGPPPLGFTGPLGEGLLQARHAPAPASRHTRAHPHTYTRSHLHAQSLSFPPGTRDGEAGLTSCHWPLHSAGDRGRVCGARRVQGRGLGAWTLPPRLPGPPAGTDEERPPRLFRAVARPSEKAGVTGPESLGAAAGRAGRRENATTGAAAGSRRSPRAHPGTRDPAWRLLRVIKIAQRPRSAARGCGAELQAKFSAVPLGAGRGLGVAAVLPKHEPRPRRGGGETTVPASELVLAARPLRPPGSPVPVLTAGPLPSAG